MTDWFVYKLFFLICIQILFDLYINSNTNTKEQSDRFNEEYIETASQQEILNAINLLSKSPWYLYLYLYLYLPSYLYLYLYFYIITMIVTITFITRFGYDTNFTKLLGGIERNSSGHCLFPPYITFLTFPHFLLSNFSPFFTF